MSLLKLLVWKSTKNYKEWLIGRISIIFNQSLMVCKEMLPKFANFFIVLQIDNFFCWNPILKIEFLGPFLERFSVIFFDKSWKLDNAVNQGWVHFGASWCAQVCINVQQGVNWAKKRALFAFIHYKSNLLSSSRNVLLQQ